jgi:hypothetical protein
MPRNKSCGCLIGGSIINFEVERKKNDLKLAQINKRIKKVKEHSKIKKLREEKKNTFKVDVDISSILLLQQGKNLAHILCC